MFATLAAPPGTLFSDLASLLGRDGGKIRGIADLSIIVPSYDTPRIQEAHITIGHIVCEQVEAALFGKKD